MKIKYLVFGLLVTVFSVINFSSAENIDVVCSGQGDCSPSPLYTFTQDYSNLCFNFSDSIYGTIYNDNGNETILNNRSNVCFDVSEGNYYFYNGSESSFSFTMSFNLGGDNTGGDNTGGNEVSNGLISQFQGVLLSFGIIISEFIPYVIYIGIGVLSVIIGFFAIRWLINRLKNKTLTPFR